MTKRFLDEEDLSNVQSDISGVRSIAQNASDTVKQVSTVAQKAADDAQAAAQNALNAYSPTNKPTAADVGARPDTWMPTAEQVGAANKEHTHIYDSYLSMDSDNAVKNSTVTNEINGIRALSADVYHKHNASDIVQGSVAIKRGGTGAETEAGAIGNLLNGIQNSIYGITDYINLPFGVTEGVYSGLKTNDPFAVTGAKRICAVRTKGSSDTVSTITVICLEGGFDTGRTFVGYCNSNTIKWHELFGTHNITSGTTDIGAGSAMTSLIHIVYED